MDRRRKHERQQSMLQAEVGELPPIAHPSRRRLCGEDPHLFLATYFPESTGMCPFSSDHDRMISRMHSVAENGGRLANGVYRGFAKTTITERFALWCVLYGKRDFVGIYGASKEFAAEILKSIRMELCENELLREDFPEICIPFQRLMGRSQRGASQTYRGELTHIVMTNDTLILPTLHHADQTAGSNPERIQESSNRTPTTTGGGIIRAKGITGTNRGMKFTRPDGRVARPDLFILDDPQTDELASNPKRVTKLFNFLRKGILKSAGHRKSAACIVNGTVIEFGDFMDQLFDKKLNWSWQTERLKLVDKWSDVHDTLWQQYRAIRMKFDPDDPDDQAAAARRATDFYLAHRAEMDAGCEVRWYHCFDPEIEVSAIQHAYNVLFDDPPEVFASEMQNEPKRVGVQGLTLLTALEVMKKVNGLPRLCVPHQAEHLTSFIDVHDDLLYWIVCAWQRDFTGQVISYGAFPEQPSLNFERSKIMRTLSTEFPGMGIEGAITKGLETLIDQLCGDEYLREDSTPITMGRVLIDGGYKLDEVETVARKSVHRSILQVSRGVGIKAGMLPISEYERRQGWRFGDNWYIKPDGKRSIRLLWIDTNHWKTFVQQRLSTPLGVPSCLTLYGTDDETAQHRSLSEHLTIERPQETYGRGRKVIEWDNPPGGDNHWGDGLVGCAVGANYLGCELPARKTNTKSRQQRIKEAAKRAGLLLE